jgi:hypothetical protein
MLCSTFTPNSRLSCDIMIVCLRNVYQIRTINTPLEDITSLLHRGQAQPCTRQYRMPRPLLVGLRVFTQATLTKKLMAGDSQPTMLHHNSNILRTTRELLSQIPAILNLSNEVTITTSTHRSFRQRRNNRKDQGAGKQLTPHLHQRR